MKRFLSVLAIVALLAAPAAYAASAAIEAAKAAGVIGEQVDGYLGFVSGEGDAALRAEVDENNIQRRNLYTQTAQQQGVSVDAVAQIAGARQVERAPAGQYVKDSTGAWIRK